MDINKLDENNIKLKLEEINNKYYFFNIINGKNWFTCYDSIIEKNYSMNFNNNTIIILFNKKIYKIIF